MLRCVVLGLLFAVRRSLAFRGNVLSVSLRLFLRAIFVGSVGRGSGAAMHIGDIYLGAFYIS